MVAEQLSGKLGKLIATYNECLRIYSIIKLVEENFPEDSEKEKNKLWALIWKDDTDKKLKACRLGKQINFRIRIAASTKDYCGAFCII